MAHCRNTGQVIWAGYVSAQLLWLHLKFSRHSLSAYLETGTSSNRIAQMSLFSSFSSCFKVFPELFLLFGIRFIQCISRSGITQPQPLKKIEHSPGSESYSKSLFHKSAGQSSRPVGENTHICFLREYAESPKSAFRDNSPWSMQ